MLLFIEIIVKLNQGKLMFVANYTTIDWGSHGIWLSN